MSIKDCFGTTDSSGGGQQAGGGSSTPEWIQLDMTSGVTKVSHMNNGASCSTTMTQASPTADIKLEWTTASGTTNQRKWAKDHNLNGVLRKGNSVQLSDTYWIDTGIPMEEIDSVSLWIDPVKFHVNAMKPVLGVILNSEMEVNDGIATGGGNFAYVAMVCETGGTQKAKITTKNATASNVLTGSSTANETDMFVRATLPVCPSFNMNTPAKAGRMGWRRQDARWIDSAANNYNSTNAAVSYGGQSEWYYNESGDTLKIGILQACGATDVLSAVGTKDMKAKIWYLINKSTTGWKP